MARLCESNQLDGFVQAVTNISKAFPKDIEAPPGGVDDMTKLSYLHEPGVLQNLATRYELNEIYVSHFYLYFFLYISQQAKEVLNTKGRALKYSYHVLDVHRQYPDRS